MALIYCRECGEQISEQAQSCPKCGAPSNPQNKKGNNKGLWIAVIFIMVLMAGAYFYFTTLNTSPPAIETRQDRIDAADRLLSRNCQVVANMVTEYINVNFFKAGAVSLAESKCGCFREKLKEKLADKYTLPQLLEFEKKPIHEKQEIKNLIEANNQELKACFPIVNQIKDKIFKK